MIKEYQQKHTNRTCRGCVGHGLAMQMYLRADHQFVQWGTTATCPRVCLAAPARLNPIGGALLPLLPGRATGAAVTAVGDQPPPPGCRAGGPRATRSPPATRVPRRRTPWPQSPGGSGERHTDAHPDRDKGPLVGSWNRREERSG